MVTEITNSFSSLFYITPLVIIAIITLIIFFIRKLNYNFKQVLKSIWISLLITISIQILVLLVSMFLLPQQLCKIGANCPTNAEVSLSFLPYTTPIIFLFVILIYYIKKFIKKK
ncbi:hypothetical protein HYV88_04945 [Candidatus Woesearchaeota archaeon]|nr:hypothetical protein [Candidatus Woesearchaeota archaeon]